MKTVVSLGGEPKSKALSLLASVHCPLEEVMGFEFEVSEELLDAFEALVADPVVCAWVEGSGGWPGGGAPETWNGAKRIGMKDMMTVRKIAQMWVEKNCCTFVNRTGNRAS